MIRSWCLFLGLFLLPQAVFASVTINEIAWMGSSVSANHEWIELYNNGPSVNLDGWILTDNENLSIGLTGTLLANSYAVLERTSDESAPGTAFLIYTGALKNTGATLSLYRADGGLEDQVSGGENWENIGGDNATKETAQYTTKGWTTGTPTPGQANVAFSEAVSQTTTSGSSGNSARLAEPVPREEIVLVVGSNELSLEIEVPKQVFVNQPVDFNVEASGVGRNIKNSLQYVWNFGDANTSTERNPTHVFKYPGKYVVHLRAEFATQEAEVSNTITVLPVAISLTKNSSHDVQINNDSPYTIDLSGYRLRGQEVLELPHNTQLLSRQTITIPYQEINSHGNTLVALYDTEGTMVASLLPSILGHDLVKAESITPVQPVAQSQPRTANPAFQFVSTAEAADKKSDLEPEADSSTTTEEDTNGLELSTTASRDINWPIFALIALLLVSCIVVLVQPNKQTNGLDKYGK